MIGGFSGLFNMEADGLYLHFLKQLPRDGRKSEVQNPKRFHMKDCDESTKTGYGACWSRAS